MGSLFQESPGADLPAYCGLTCQTCPIYLATLQTDKDEQLRMRKEVVLRCREHYGIHFALKDITDCDGCRTQGGRLFAASTACTIRKCASKKELVSCAGCSDYPCNELRAFFEKEPGAKTRLDSLRSSR